MKRMNKKGQQLSTTAMVLLVLGIVVLVVVAIAVANFYGWIGQKTDVLPGELEAAAQSCQISAAQGLKTSYCNEFKEIKVGGEKQYFNCVELIKLGAILEDKLDEDECEQDSVDAAAEAFCGGLKDDDMVNNKVCCDVVNNVCSGSGWGRSSEHPIDR